MIESLTISLLTGVTSGVFASYLFLVFYLKNKKPLVRISPYISHTEFNGQKNYFFKFVNLTDTEIFDVRVEATFYKPFGDVSGTNLRSKDIDLADCYFMHIPANKSDDKHNLHAVRVRTIQDLSSEWTDESSFIRVKIMAKHSLSGLNKVFFQDYNSRDCITTKKFVSGSDLGVK